MKTTIRYIGLVFASLFLFVSFSSAQAKPHLLNVSTRAVAGSGENTLIIGFTTSPGSTSIRVLLRGVGPGLLPFGITTAIKTAKLQLFSGTTLLTTNLSWKSNIFDEATVRAANIAVGAFALPDDGKDCAMVVFLQPGSPYTLQLSSLDGSTGPALIEVYELP